MDKETFINLINEIENAIRQNKKKIDQALDKEMSKGNILNIKRVFDILNDYKQMNSYSNEGKSIAVCYQGRPEITVGYILDSILFNNQVTLCINENKIINDVIVTIIVDTMRKLNIKNLWINYRSTYNEIYLRDNEKDYQKIIFIGDFYEYEMFKSFFKKDVEYNNYGYIKLFIDKDKQPDEYKKIMNHAAKENLFIEAYTDIDDFVNESKQNDFAIAYVSDFKDINKLQKLIKAEELLINTFPYDTYKFKINR